MANCPRCGTVVAGGCQCSFADSECIEMSIDEDGVISPVAIISDDPDNIIESTPQGLFAAMRDRFVIPTVRKVRNTPVSVSANDPITYNVVEYDDYGMSFSTSEVEIPFDGMWSMIGYANYDNNDGSFNTIRLELDQGAGYSIVSAAREQRDNSVVHETYVSHPDEFFMNTGDLVRLTVGEDATSTISLIRASLVVTFRSLER